MNRSILLKTFFSAGTVIWLVVCSVNLAQGQTGEIVLYKQIDTAKLYLEVFKPVKMDPARQYPALVFFFGGGWKSGNRQQFAPHARYFAQRGIVCFLADYRTATSHQTTPFESLKDAKSAIRLIRREAETMGIDPTSIIASGGSAGGHLAAATALISKYNEDTDDLSISCAPNALVLFNPVVDNGPGGYGYNELGEQYRDYSPLHNIKAGAPPTLFLLGTKDNLIPVPTAEYFKVVMEKVGSRCDLRLYEGQLHGFFNYRFFDNYKTTLLEMDGFLQSLGYIGKEPTVEIK